MRVRMIGLALVAAACGDGRGPSHRPDAASPDAPAVADAGADAVRPTDSGAPVDSTVPGQDAPPIDAAAPDSGTPDAMQPQDAGVDAVVIDAPIPIDAGAPPDVPGDPGGIPQCPSTPTPCVVSVLSASITAATVGWRVCCPAGLEAISIVQVGVSPGFGEWDSVVTACGEPRTMELGLNAGDGSAWASIDTIEWPYTMESPITHCGTAGSP
jgi:hypothetical protein